MLSRSLNDTSRVIKMIIIDDAMTWSVTFEDSADVIYDRNMYIIQATDV
jgi:hypothetical protein